MTLAGPVAHEVDLAAQAALNSICLILGECLASGVVNACTAPSIRWVGSVQVVQRVIALSVSLVRHLRWAIGHGSAVGVIYASLAALRGVTGADIDESLTQLAGRGLDLVDGPRVGAGRFGDHVAVVAFRVHAGGRGVGGAGGRRGLRAGGFDGGG